MSYKEEQPKTEVEKDPETEVKVSEDEELMLDERMKQVLSEGAHRLVVPQYKTLKRGHISVSFAVIDAIDYYYQIELSKEVNLSRKDILTILIMALDTVVPRHIHTFIREPTEGIPLYTIVVQGAGRLPNAKKFMEDKLVDKLLNLNFWP